LNEAEAVRLALPAAWPRPSAGPDRDPVVALDGGRQRRVGQRPGQGLQRQPEGLQDRAHLQGQLRRVHDRGHRRLPRRQRAAHPAGLRGGHRHHDGQQGRDRAGHQGDEGRRLKFDPACLRARGGRLLHGAERPDAELPVQQLDHRLLLQQGRLQGGRPGPRQAAQTWPEVALAAAKLKASGHKCPFTTAGRAGRSWRASRLAQRLFATKNNGFGGLDARWPSTRRCTCATSRTWPTWPSRACSSTRAAATPPRRPSSRASAP
jgi:hypothetical protein